MQGVGCTALDGRVEGSVEAINTIRVPRGLEKNHAQCTMERTVRRGEKEEIEGETERRGFNRASRYMPPYSGLYRGM